ncbi:MAG TPA: YfiR family protein [Methylomirabilota bacterium]|nr:YfiR family protein [Methylomirabilota bacterium]
MAVLRSIRLFALLVAALAGLLFAPPHAQESSSAGRLKATEWQIKGAYLYNFALFTRWPAAAFKGKDSPFVIAILGDDPFGAPLDDSLVKEQVNGRPIRIVRAPTGAAVPECHLLFISVSEKRRLQEIFDSISGKPIFTVADFEPFCQVGGGARFRKDGRNIRLVMNPGAIRAAGLRVDAELLQMATLKETEPRK